MTDVFAQIDIRKLQELREENIGRLLLHAYRHFNTLAFDKLHARGHTGLGLNHAALLANLDIEGTRITVLAERAGMTKQSMGELAQDLEQKGYIQRAADPVDKRATIIQFTEAGCRYLVDAYEIKQEIESEYAAVLGAGSMDQLRAFLKALGESAPTGDNA
ncbi:MAG: MarR family winged helix-turn-helix transcriptional regulator [Anaerolineae bacterium]